MQLYKLAHDITVFCVAAKSFPKGIKDAFDGLNKVASLEGRHIFGISKPGTDGVIRYRASASENFEGESGKLGCPAFTIEKGIYLGETLMDWQQNEMMIMSIFDRLVADKRLDGSAHCIEWYKGHNELLCMVLMQSDKVSGETQQLDL